MRSELFTAYLLTRNNRIVEDLIDQLFNSSEKRLARVLFLFAHFGREGRPQPIGPNINQQTLAEMIGTPRSHVSTFMNRFRKLGFISYNGNITVHHSLSIEQRRRAQWQRVSRLFLREQATPRDKCVKSAGELRQKVLYNLWYYATFSRIEIATTRG
jgi:Crp-like helix-turn-helix domain